MLVTMTKLDFSGNGTLLFYGNEKKFSSINSLILRTSLGEKLGLERRTYLWQTVSTYFDRWQRCGSGRRSIPHFVQE